MHVVFLWFTDDCDRASWGESKVSRSGELFTLGAHQNRPRPSNVIPFWPCYGFWLGYFVQSPKKELQGKASLRQAGASREEEATCTERRRDGYMFMCTLLSLQHRECYVASAV